MPDIDDLKLDGNNFTPSQGQPALPVYADKYNDLLDFLTDGYFTGSITAGGGTAGFVNDERAPGNNKLYGTSNAGVRGWQNAFVIAGANDTIPYVAASAFVYDSSFAFNGTTLVVPLAQLTGLTANNAVIHAGTGGLLEEDANFTWDGSAVNISSGSDSLAVVKLYGANDDGVRASILTNDTSTLAAFYAYDENDGGTAAYANTYIGHTTTPAFRAVGGTVAELYFGADKKFETSTTGANVTGDLTVSGLNTNDAVIHAGTGGLLEADANLTWDGASLVANVGAANIQSGDGSGAASLVAYSATASGADLLLQSGNNYFQIWYSQGVAFTNFNNPDGGIGARFNDGGSVDLYYDNAKKLATHLLGGFATGNLGADGVPTGATQGGAGVTAGWLWQTESHATLPDGVLCIGV